MWTSVFITAGLRGSYKLTGSSGTERFGTCLICVVKLWSVQVHSGAEQLGRARTQLVSARSRECSCSTSFVNEEGMAADRALIAAAFFSNHVKASSVSDYLPACCLSL